MFGNKITLLIILALLIIILYIAGGKKSEKTSKEFINYMTKEGTLLSDFNNRLKNLL